MAVAQANFWAAPTDDVTVCGTLDLVNAYGEQASFDLGCRRPNVLPASAALCRVTQFLPQPVRPVVEERLEC